MRFRFCGDLDAPDWLLAEIATLSKLPSTRMVTLVKHVMGYLLAGQIDFEKVLHATKETLPDNSDVQGALAALTFMLTNAAKYDVDDEALLQEIQQLGMPKENSEAIAQRFREHKQELRVELARTSYQLPKLRAVDWRVDQVISSREMPDKMRPLAHLSLTIDEAPNRRLRLGEGGEGRKDVIRKTNIRISPEKLMVLHHELKQALSYMESIK